MSKPWADVREWFAEVRRRGKGDDFYALQLKRGEEILADADALLAVARAAEWQPDILLMQKAVKWSKANYKHIGDYPTVNEGARSYINGCRRVRIEEALDALPKHLRRTK